MSLATLAVQTDLPHQVCVWAHPDFLSLCLLPSNTQLYPRGSQSSAGGELVLVSVSDDGDTDLHGWVVISATTSTYILQAHLSLP